ncbi:TPA: hypothetical protein ACKJ8X_000909, partial [Neisseria gonorrhoeae]
AAIAFICRLRCGREEKRREEKRREEKRREEKRREEKFFCRPYAYQLQISKIKLLKRLSINAKYFIRFVLPGYDFFLLKNVFIF